MTDGLPQGAAWMAPSSTTARPAPQALTHFTWDGNRLLAEATCEQTQHQIRRKLYLYEPDSFVPLAHKRLGPRGMGQ